MRLTTIFLGRKAPLNLRFKSDAATAGSPVPAQSAIDPWARFIRSKPNYSDEEISAAIQADIKDASPNRWWAK